jgi:hypothetical protein
MTKTQTRPQTHCPALRPATLAVVAQNQTHCPAVTPVTLAVVAQNQIHCPAVRPVNNPLAVVE